MNGEMQSMARQVFLTYQWPFFSYSCSLDPCFSSAWCLKLSFPFLDISPQQFFLAPHSELQHPVAVMPLKESC